MRRRPTDYAERFAPAGVASAPRPTMAAPAAAAPCAPCTRRRELAIAGGLALALLLLAGGRR